MADLPLKLCADVASDMADCKAGNFMYLNGIISINERSTFR